MKERAPWLKPRAVHQFMAAAAAAARMHLLLRVVAVAAYLLLLLAPPPPLSRAATVVTRLPGFDGALPSRLETGYVGVDDATGAELFYYLVESERSPRADPLVLWHSGGPRCSALSALAFQIGPVRFVERRYDGALPRLVRNPYSLTQLKSEVDKEGILDPVCPFASPKPWRDALRRKSLAEEHYPLSGPPDEPTFGCLAYRYYLSYFWANDNTTRAALGIKEGTVKEWIRCKLSGELPYTSDLPSSIEYHLNLTTRGYRALVYSGDHDLTVPFSGTQAWIRSLNFSIVDDWRAWHLDGQAAGFTITYANNLTFATIKGGRHIASENRPKECFAIVKRWLDNEPL